MACYFESTLGHDWREKIDAAAEQADYARAKMPWLSLFETKAGAVTASPDNPDGDKPDGTNPDDGDDQ